ncbi:phosphonate metabolism protein/1,5-bisphosphokinase (PRPP-forming) PhnN [Pseudaminobacter sp. 19-2017]|uniref:Ribose 1,5-bisphosphate phosphokinase PhnN n=1 Tax=Pseudaminobacter soli (ex Zhang et al. 2022) TaxID=2831468 RepID=A0A942E006_9HYPH|nr:phosphonate metabolism protein/1,5-bisphosphokinase (PRPP-forming) PhnN [Pseudaminobacter soli]MBS3650563.1 phosphonate metabolism protein/1,5-bisphosphokinase (PRPP-forming) PhnN [Pseudaminobacter soli]
MPEASAAQAPAQGERGVLLAVVGPSGAGKDSLMAHARERLGDDPSVLFVRRVITRSAVPSAEDHDALTAEAFAEAQSSGMFAVTWQAHGLHYGIPAEVHQHLAAGGVAVVNGSRAALREIHSAFEHVVTVQITCNPAVLASRLAARGRESQAEIEQRLSRAASVPSDCTGDVIEIDNSGEFTVAGSKFVEIILQCIRRRS